MEAVNTNFKMVGLTRLGVKLWSADPEADALTSRPSELSDNRIIINNLLLFCVY